MVETPESAYQALLQERTGQVGGRLGLRRLRLASCRSRLSSRRAKNAGIERRSDQEDSAEDCRADSKDRRHTSSAHTASRGRRDLPQVLGPETATESKKRVRFITGSYRVQYYTPCIYGHFSLENCELSLTQQKHTNRNACRFLVFIARLLAGSRQAQLPVGCNVRTRSEYSR